MLKIRYKETDNEREESASSNAESKRKIVTERRENARRNFDFSCLFQRFFFERIKRGFKNFICFLANTISHYIHNKSFIRAKDEEFWNDE